MAADLKRRMGQTSVRIGLESRVVLISIDFELTIALVQRFKKQFQ